MKALINLFLILILFTFSITASATRYTDTPFGYLYQSADPSVQDGMGLLYSKTDGDIYWLDSITGTPRNILLGGSTSLNSLTDVTITSATTSDFLEFNGTVWVNSPSAAATSLQLDQTVPQSVINGAPNFFGLDFDIAQPNPTHAEGKVFYDNEEKALAYYNEEAEVTVQIGQYLFFRTLNGTPSTITRGTVVAPDLATGISPASSKEKLKSRIIGVASHDIEPGTWGYVATFGRIDGLDTSMFAVGDVLYLNQTGGYSTTRPDDGEFPVIIGGVTLVSATSGEIAVNIASSELTVEVTDTNGFPPDQRDTTTMLISGTSTYSFEIAPDGSDFHYYVLGDKFEATATSTVVFDDTQEGEHLFYFDSSGLQTIHEPTSTQKEAIILNNAFVASIYWDATGKQVVGDIWDERHGISMSPETHLYLHTTRGAQFLDGLGLGDILAGESGALDTHAQFSVAAGSITDEDLKHTLASSIAVGVTIPVLYLSGSSTSAIMNEDTQTGFAFLNAAAGRPYYNELTGGAWQLTEITSGNHILVHVFALNGQNETIFAVMGQNGYSTVGDARDGASEEINSIITGFDIAEAVPLGTIILQGKDSYANSVKARIVEVSTGVDYVDWRTTELAQGANPSSHLNLTNVEAATLGITQGHINDTTQEIHGAKTFADILSASTSIDILENDATSTPVSGLSLTAGSDKKLYLTNDLGVTEKNMTSASLIDELSDVVITSATTSEVLTFDGTNWANAPPTGTGGAGDADTLHLIRTDDIELSDIDLTGNNTDFDGGGTITAGSLVISSTSTDLIMGTTVIKYAPGADGSDDYFGFTKEIEQGFRGRDIGFSFEYKNEATAVDGSFRFAVKIKDGASAGNIEYFDMDAYVPFDDNSITLSTSSFIPSDCTEIEFGWQNITATTTVELMVDNILVSASPFVYKEITETESARFDTYAGYGSTNTRIPYFTNEASNLTGSIISIENSSTNGFSVTALRDCVVNVNFNIGSPTGVVQRSGLSLNSNQLSTNIGSITASHRVSMEASGAVGGYDIVLGSAVPVEMSAGDVLRPHTQAAVPATAAYTNFTVTATAATEHVITPAKSNMSDWEQYTPSTTGFGTVSGMSMWKRRVGSNLEIKGTFTAGTTDGTTATIGLPSGLTAAASTGASTPNGRWFSANPATPAGNIICSSTNNAIFFAQEASGINGQATLTGSQVSGSSVSVGINASVPIDGWSSDAVFLAAIPVAGKTLVRIQQGLGLGATTNIRRFSNFLDNTGGGVIYTDDTSLGGKFTVQSAGLYHMHYVEDITGAIGATSGISLNSTQLTTSITGITVADRLSIETSDGSGHPFSQSVSRYLETGDVIRAHTDGNAAFTTSANAMFTITK